ncbi:sigma-70 family RNA polymerase sigma factor [Streptomyces sp. N35]|uniref:sigma-70 family RNA polymerase sigma factor n=1 Tax=Streptomyces sp. N35 TaxID=2795730 RepID=UPI0027DAF821|nr:sigma-70 family RNA polymerase sigma factor [Streptomyces sp. N35]
MPVETSQAASDAELHRRLVYGDESALAAAYDVYGGLVRRIALRVAHAPGAADDVAQEGFAHLWSRPYPYDPQRGTLRTWLSMLAHRRSVDWVRAEERHRKAAHTDEAALHAIPAPGPGPDEAVVDMERALLLHSALAELPLPQRQAVHLAYFAGHSYRQVAAELGIPEGTAKTRLRTALRRLAATLAEPQDTAVDRVRDVAEEPVRDVSKEAGA